MSLMPTDELPPGLARAWGVAAPPRRGPKPTHSVDGIVQAALELVDAGGIEALSFPKLAARVGVATNALYRYVDSKEELLVLVRDAGWGDPPSSIRVAGSWRDAVRAWTHAALDGYRARPWLLDVPVHGAPMTPHLLRWLEVLLAALAGAGLNGDHLLKGAMLVDGYAFSGASLARKLSAARAEPGQSAAAWEFLLPRLAEDDFPVLGSLLTGGAYGEGDGTSDGDVDFGLDRILDGIETLITRGGTVAQ
jgi:AcrR family transcriptional regulator